MSEELVERFGFLPYDWVLEISGVKIEPLPDYATRRGHIEELRHKSGFVFPPPIQEVSENLLTGEKRVIPKSDRPAHLWRLGASHVLRLTGNYASGRSGYGADAFIMHLLAYLCGVRLQFEDWWLDLRVPVDAQATHHVADVMPGVAAHFVERALATWLQWGEPMRTHFTSLLYVHSRVPSYEWPWERLFFEYAVTDGLWSIANDLRWLLVKYRQPGKRLSHGERIDVLCKEFGLFENRDLVKEIVKLRNELVHMALWDNSMPGAGGSTGSFLAPDHLRRLNQRLIPALLAYRNTYTTTNWASFSSWTFDAGP
jgi:hypothetical protein